MQQVILTKGLPASSKTTWAKAKISEDPQNWCRVNNDEIRSMCNNSDWSSSYEKIISEIRSFAIKTGLKRGKSIIVDNLNISKDHFNNIVSIVKELNIDCTISEKHFYLDVEEAILRDSKREGKAKVGEAVIRNWDKKLGGKQFAKATPRVENVYKQNKNYVPLVISPNKLNGIIMDLDGTLANIGDRSPYDAQNCDITDYPNEAAVFIVNKFYESNYKIIFCSGRSEKDRAPTERFIKQYLPNIEYILYMRPDGNYQKDAIIKENIFNKYIKDKYNIFAVFDDRLSVCKLWHSLGLNLFRLGDPEANF